MFEMQPIGHVQNRHTNVQDDSWGRTESLIVLIDALAPDALAGLQEFSHAEIIYHFHQVEVGQIVTGTRHPRNNPAWPKIGIFAQRGRNRPNRIGSSVVRILRVEGRALHVAELDAINGTPVLDIKPVMAEFLPREEVRQPKWSREVMEIYWQPRRTD